MNDAEKELLDLLIAQCRALRDPHNPSSRPEMAAAAATWEIKFEERKKEIVKPSKRGGA